MADSNTMRPASRPPQRAQPRKPAPSASKLPPGNSSPRYSLRSGRNIIPRETIIGQALSTVIIIMAFLACLTVGAVSIVNQTAKGWQSEISREVTIQIRPFDDVEMDNAVRQASRLVLKFDGIAKITALDGAASARLLEPWLGSGLDLAELPVPRLLTVSAKPGATPDFAAIRKALAENVPGASLDDHRVWTGRLNAMAWTVVAIGLGVLALVLVATVLTVVFATRGAMVGNRSIVEVLHFVGADGRFIAREFERHFLVLALRSSLIGGVASTLVFIVLGIWAQFNQATPQADQLAALFGSFIVNWMGYAGIAVVVVLIAFLAAGTSRLTVMKQVGDLERYRTKSPQ
ncbi:MAG: cell division protein FtsX [Rhizobiaceae bacterium]